MAGVEVTVHNQDRWGYDRSYRKMIITPQFDRAQRFSEGLAGVEQNGHMGYIDKLGSFVIPATFRVHVLRLKLVGMTNGRL